MDRYKTKTQLIKNPCLTNNLMNTMTTSKPVHSRFKGRKLSQSHARAKTIDT